MKNELNDITKLAGLNEGESSLNLNPFTKAYIETALHHAPVNSDGTPYTMADIEDYTLQVMIRDCKKFLSEVGSFMLSDELERGGRIFWNTRNYEDEAGTFLSDDHDWGEYWEELYENATDFREFRLYLDEYEKLTCDKPSNYLGESVTKTFSDHMAEAFADEYQQRKQQRKKDYDNTVGFKKRKCSACNGSGTYDSKGSPKCGACNGTGKERYKPVSEGTEKPYVDMDTSLKLAFKQALKRGDATAVFYYREMARLRSEGKLSACADADTFLNSWAGHEWFKKNKENIQKIANEYTKDSNSMGRLGKTYKVVTPRHLKEDVAETTKYTVQARPARAKEIRELLANFSAANKGMITKKEAKEGTLSIFTIEGPPELVKKLRIDINNIMFESASIEGIKKAKGNSTCGSLFNCCDCGCSDGGCGCAYCFSCNACEHCLDDTGEPCENAEWNN